MYVALEAAAKKIVNIKRRREVLCPIMINKFACILYNVFAYPSKRATPGS